MAHWLRALSDGFVDLDPDDVYVKAPGPVVVRRLPHEQAGEWQERPPASDQFDAKAVGLGAAQAVLDWDARERRPTRSYRLPCRPCQSFVGRSPATSVETNAPL